MIGAVSPRSLRGMLVLVGAASVALAGAGADALLPFRDAAAAATDVGVALVVDFGGSSVPIVGCVKVPASDTGYQALTAFATQEHWALPTYNGSGLLCSINGDPVAPACGQSVPGGYQFWSYWFMTDGTGSWAYANRGASAPVGTARNGQDVEGWRFENPGPDNSSAPAPRAAPHYSGICAAVLSAPTSAPTVPAAVTTSTASPSAPIAHLPAPTGGPASTAPVAPVPAPVPTTATSTASTTSTTPLPPATHSEALGATPTAARQPGGGSVLPLLGGGLVVILLAVGAFLGWRRRSGTP